MADIQALVAELSKMTVMEIVELTKALEDIEEAVRVRGVVGVDLNEGAQRRQVAGQVKPMG